MSPDWEWIAAAMVVVSFEFLAIGVIILTLRAYRGAQASGESTSPPAPWPSSFVPEPALLPGPYLQFSNATPVVGPAPKFLALGTEIDSKLAADDVFGGCWDEEADWADLVDKPTAPLRRRPRASIPSTERETHHALPIHRASQQQPPSDASHPIFGKETRVFDMGGYPLRRFEN